MDSLLSNINKYLNNDTLRIIYNYYNTNYIKKKYIQKSQQKYNKDMLLEEFNNVIIKYKDHFGYNYPIYKDDFDNILKTVKEYDYNYSCPNCGYDYDINSMCYNCQ